MWLARDEDVLRDGSKMIVERHGNDLKHRRFLAPGNEWRVVTADGQIHTTTTEPHPADAMTAFGCDTPLMLSASITPRDLALPARPAHRKPSNVSKLVLTSCDSGWHVGSIRLTPDGELLVTLTGWHSDDVFACDVRVSQASASPRRDQTLAPSGSHDATTLSIDA